MALDPFEWPLRIYFEDTDAAGIFYYARYLHYMERARTEWLRAKEMDVQELARDQRIVFTVRSVCVDYLRPARLSDTVYASVVVRRVGGASIDLSQVIRRDHETLCAGTVRLACVDVDSMRPRRMPTVLASAIRHDTKK